MPFANVEDDDVLAQQSHQNPTAFAELYRRHMPPVYRYVLIRTQNVEDAQDVTAQTFMTAFERIQSYRPQGKFRAWLFGIARHKTVDYFRKVKLMTQLDHIEQLPHPAPSPDEIVTQKLELERVQVALTQLAPDRAEALSLRLFGELSAREIAGMLGKTEGAVKMLIHRGWQDLRAILMPAVPSEGEA